MPFFGFEPVAHRCLPVLHVRSPDHPALLGVEVDEALGVEVEGGEVEALVRSELLGVFGDLGGRGGAETRRFPSLLNPFS